MLTNNYIEQYSGHLFWDVKKEDIDFDKYPQYVVKRVLEYGFLSDWKLICAYYGLSEIIKIAKELKELEPHALAYIAAISKTPKEEFRCYTYQQSIPPHWNF